MSRAVRLICLVALVLIARAESPPAAAAGGLAWARPVGGAPARAFSYDPADPFVRGGHRGVDFRAAAGATVRAACGGRVVTARPGQVVTLRCGPWRVTHLPLARVTVHVGDRVAAGARLGSLGTSSEHPGLHLGVRAARDRFAYVDPLAFLSRARLPRLPPPPPTARGRHRLLPPPVTAPERPRLLHPPGAARVRVPSAGGLAPWAAWVGLALVLCGALGGGVRWRVQARRVRAPARVLERVP